eukprot:TRINITY_DN6164_c0_g5_i1.p1 TRINITY_DN6164_c0_g5~~TRINITY_DN6164_c0_g5_i1.p1  ORF type:complete len:406 (-),score=139.02 TRINITY_DN6164_c0_g5_i1:13-1128(-)
MSKVSFLKEECFETPDEPVNVPPVGLISDVEDKKGKKLNFAKAFQKFSSKTVPTPTSTNPLAEKTVKRDVTDETPLESYRRLKGELEIFLQDLISGFQGDDLNKPLEQNITPAQLIEQLKILQSELTQLELLEKNNQPPTPSDSNNKKSSEGDVLESQLQAFKIKDENVNTNAEKVKQYEIYLKQSEEGRENLELLELEKRVVFLENLFSVKPQDTTNRGSLFGSLSTLSQRVSLLDPIKLEHLSIQLVNLLSLSSSPSDTPKSQNSQNERVKQLVNKVEKWEKEVEGIEGDVQRIDSLAEIHFSLSSFPSQLSLLDQHQELIYSRLKENNQLVQELKQNIQENMKMVEKNVNHLNERFLSLSAKLELLNK